MSSFVSFGQFIRHGGQASIILSLRAVEPSLELKQSPLDPATVDALEQRLRELAAETGPASQQPSCGRALTPTQPPKASRPKLLRRGRHIQIRLPRSWHLATHLSPKQTS